MSEGIPSDHEASAGHAVLIEVLTILGKYRDGMVLIGGWVPDVLFPNSGHIGSFDVDLALDARKIRPDAYESIRKRLIAEGYVQEDLHSGIFRKNLGEGAGAITVKLDLVTGDESDGTGTEARDLIQDLSIGRLRGVEIALDHASAITLKGALPSGVENTVTAQVVTVPAYLCLKAFALNERMKEKDAYDVYFCLKHYAGGPAVLATDCRGLLGIPRAREAMDILKQKFETLNGVGPQWAGDVASGGGEDRETVVRDAFERASSRSMGRGGDSSASRDVCVGRSRGQPGLFRVGSVQRETKRRRRRGRHRERPRGSGPILPGRPRSAN